MPSLTSIREDRPLTAEETNLIRWLLEHGEKGATAYLSQLANARVSSRCGCGCPSINFAIDGRKSPVETGQSVLSDYYWKDSAGHEFGIFVFASKGMLGGLDVYSADGLGENDKLPSVNELLPVDSGRA